MLTKKQPNSNQIITAKPTISATLTANHLLIKTKQNMQNKLSRYLLFILFLLSEQEL
jgi:hypothetical protein